MDARSKGIINHSPGTQISKRSGFSLIELLVVVAIITLLAALIVPALDGLRSGNVVTQAAAELAGKLDLARQLALTENERVELRILRAPKEDGSRELTYRLIQIYRTADGIPLDKPHPLPIGTEVSNDPTFSSLLSDANKLQGVQSNVGPLSNLAYKAVMFRPDGSTHLSPDGPANDDPLWTLTVLRSVDAGKADLPANFATVTCDPVTGRSTIYRP